LGGRGRQIPEFEASLVYRVSFRTAKAAKRNPVLKNNTNKETNNQMYRCLHTVHTDLLPRL
jgi:hypothetical protein